MVQFRMDGNTYDVDVLNLTRRFSITETGMKGITQDGEIHRDLIGTYYNYTFTHFRHRLVYHIPDIRPKYLQAH